MILSNVNQKLVNIKQKSINNTTVSCKTIRTNIRYKLKTTIIDYSFPLKLRTLPAPSTELVPYMGHGFYSTMQDNCYT